MSPIAISQHELAQATREFPGSLHQRRIHNQLVGRLEELRLKLEIASPQEVPGLQGSIREVRAFLAEIHAEDTVHIKALYVLPIIRN